MSYEPLVATNQKRSRNEPEFELIDTGIFEGDRYFDVVVEYAKAAPEDVLIRIAVHNRGPEAKSLHVLPTLWFRNTWSRSEGAPRPELRAGPGMIAARHAELGEWFLHCGEVPDQAGAAGEGRVPRLLFTENETNRQRIWNQPNRSAYVKDGIHRCVIEGQQEAVNPQGIGTKAAAHYPITVGPGQEQVIRLRLNRTAGVTESVGPDYDEVLAARRREADEFYAAITPASLGAEAGQVMRQALAMVDRDFAHRQLDLMLRERYLHPNGQIPACEWNFGDVNPPVHAWADLFVCRNEEDGVFYDVLRLPDGHATRLKVRSMVGLLPLCATTVVSRETLQRLPNLLERAKWFLSRNQGLAARMAPPDRISASGYHLLGLLDETKLRRVLARADLDARQPPARACAVEAAPLLRQRFQGGMPDRFRPAAHPPRGGRGDQPTVGRHLPARCPGRRRESDWGVDGVPPPAVFAAQMQNSDRPSPGATLPSLCRGAASKSLCVATCTCRRRRSAAVCSGAVPRETTQRATTGAAQDANGVGIPGARDFLRAALSSQELQTPAEAGRLAA